MKNEPQRRVIRKKLRRRLTLTRLGALALFLAMIVIGEMSDWGLLLDSRAMSAQAQRVSRLVVFGGMVLMLALGWHIRHLLAHRTDRNRQRVREEDERRRLIQEQSSHIALQVLLLLGVAAVLILSYVNMTAFTTACAILLTALLLKGAAWLWVRTRT